MDTDNNKPFKVTVIGSGAAMPAAGKYHSAHVLNVHGQYYLMDCGEGTQKAMLENGINPQKLKAIFISHLHGDHIYGLFPLLDTLGLSQRSCPLQVYAPAPLGDLLNCISRYLNGSRPYDIEYHEVDSASQQIVYEDNSVAIRTVPLHHRVPAVGYYCRERTPELNIRKEAIERYSLDVADILAAKRGEDLLVNGKMISNDRLTYTPFIPRSYAYCTDTVYSEEIARQINGVDLLYHEATYAAVDEELARLNGHSTSVEAACIALLAGAKKLLVGHFSRRYRNPSQLVEEARRIFPETEEAVEGRTYEVR